MVPTSFISGPRLKGDEALTGRRRVVVHNPLRIRAELREDSSVFSEVFGGWRLRWNLGPSCRMFHAGCWDLIGSFGNYQSGVGPSVARPALEYLWPKLFAGVLRETFRNIIYLRSFEFGIYHVRKLRFLFVNKLSTIGTRSCQKIQVSHANKRNGNVSMTCRVES